VAGYIVAGLIFAAFFYIFFLRSYSGIFKDSFTAVMLLAALLTAGAIIIRYIKGELIIEEEGLKTEKGFIKFGDIRKILISDEKRRQRIMKIGDMMIIAGNITVEIKNIDEPEKLSDLIEDLRGQD
jgi:uncharacterized membrane protein YobD (UPF0266 family)